MTQQWTFDALALSDKATLERIMVEAAAPDIEKLDGLSYCGWNHDAIGKITGEKFKKGFSTRNGVMYGYNETVAQDKDGHTGSWRSKSLQAKPLRMGFFKVSYVKDESWRQVYPLHRHHALFNYNIPDNKWHKSFFRVIRDFVVSPNKDDHSLLLGKAYLQLWGKMRISCCYFLLAYPEATHFFPDDIKTLNLKNYQS